MSAVMYMGEQGGGRVLRYGTGITNVRGTNDLDYQFDLGTWDIVPAGEVGDNVFRSIDASFKYTNGYSIGITPIVDGVEQGEQLFNGAGSGEKECQAFFALRGTRVAARLRTLARSGDIEFHDLSCSYWMIRQTP